MGLIIINVHLLMSKYFAIKFNSKSVLIGRTIGRSICGEWEFEGYQIMVLYKTNEQVFLKVEDGDCIKFSDYENQVIHLSPKQFEAVKLQYDKGKSNFQGVLENLPWLSMETVNHLRDIIQGAINEVMNIIEDDKYVPTC